MKPNLYFVSMFKNVFDYFTSDEVLAKYNFLGQNEALISIEDKGYIFVFVYNFTTETFGLKLQSDFLNNDNLYVVPDLIEGIEVYDIELLCNQYKNTKNKSNQYLCSFVHENKDFYKYIYFYDKNIEEYSYDEFLIYLHKINCYPSNIVLCHKSKMILNSNEIPLYDRVLEFNLAHILKSKIVFDYIVNNNLYVEIQSVGILNLDKVFKCIKHLKGLSLYIEYNFISIEHLVKYLAYITEIFNKNQTNLNNINKEIIIEIDLQKKVSLDNIYLFLNSYGKEKGLYLISVLLKNGIEINPSNYFRIYI